jgi:hypothetical protein
MSPTEIVKHSCKTEEKMGTTKSLSSGRKILMSQSIQQGDLKRNMLTLKLLCKNDTRKMVKIKVCRSSVYRQLRHNETIISKPVHEYYKGPKMNIQLAVILKTNS